MNGHPNGNGQPVLNGVAADRQESTPAVESQESQQPGLKVETPATTTTTAASPAPAEQKPAETTTTPTTSGVESGTAALQLGSDSVDVKEDTKMESPVLPQEPAQEPSGVTNPEQTQEKGQTTKAEAPSTPPQTQPSQTPQDTEMTPAPALRESVSEKPEQQPAAETETAVKESPQAQEQKETVVATPEPTAAAAAAATSEAKPQTPTQPLNRPDQEMAEAPPASPMKVARGRDEDASEEPAAKRAKTDDVSTESQFKVPDLSTASAASNGLPSTSKPISKLQTKFLTRCLVGLKRTHDSRFFRVPVDPIKLNIPSYPTIVKQPMDLGTIENKLRSGQYHTVDAVISDFKLMVDNSTAFNGTEHVVTIEGKNLFQTFERHLSKLPDAEQAEPVTEKKPKKAPALPKAPSARREPRSSTGGGRGVNATSPTFALGPEGLPLIRRDSTTVDGRPKRSIHPPKNRELPYSMKPKKKKFQWELKFCQEVLDELHKAKHYSFASPFYLPVDPVALNIPTYHNIIKKPMDLSTVQTKLNTGQYENAKEMEVDVKQIFKNCYKFNIFGDPTYNAGKRLEEVFDAKWSQKGRWLETHEPSSGHQSVGSTDESDNDEEESDDGEQERLHLLQKQIAEMSKQVEAISKKKKSPPASKKSKAKPGKKDTKKAPGAASRKDKKNTKPARPEKQRWVTYQEKQVISNGISSLPDKKMNEALRIIQQNVPSLKVSCFFPSA